MLDSTRKDQVLAAAHRLLALYYQSNDIDALMPCLAPEFTWIGSGDGQQIDSRLEAERYFRRYQIPLCEISDEKFAVSEAAPGAYACTGALRVSHTMPDGTRLSALQRISMFFRVEGDTLLCTHIHSSTPDREAGVGALLTPAGPSYTVVNRRISALRRQMLDEKRQMDFVLSSIPGGLVICRADDDRTFVSVTPGAAKLFGYTPEEFLAAFDGRGVRAIYPPDYPAANRDAVAALAKDNTYAIKYRVPCKDGSLKYILDTGRKVWTEEETYLYSLYLDVTDTETATRELVRKTSLLNSIYDTIPYGVIRFIMRDGTFQLVTANMSALQMLGCPGMDPLIKKWDPVIGAAAVLPEDRHILLSACRKLRNVGDRVDVEYRAVLPDGTVHWIMGSNMMVDMEPDGSAVIQRVFSDISENKRLARQIQVEQENYDIQVQARQAMEQAYEAAERANRAKSEFLSRMSHDIRTPMNAIIGMTEIARRESGDPERVADCLEKISASSDHLLRLINEVLDMSKIESQSFTMDQTVFSLADVAGEAVDLIRDSAEKRRQELTVEIGPLAHPSVTGDPLHVKQILLNFLSNAVKYTEEGGHILFRMTEGPRTKGGAARFEFVIQDDGIGMTEEFQKRIFLPFERAEDSRVSKTQGTGLGMSIAYNLVKMMNGSIELQSAVNQGSRFTVTLFFMPADLPQEPAIHEKAPDLPGITFQGSPVFLLVEDNDLNREIARDLLEMAGAVVEEAVDGADSVKKFSAAPPGYYQAILMDIQMPVMGGYEATRAIRALDRPDAADIPIVALTANAFSEDVQNARDAGMDTHLAKPLDPVLLVQTLKRLVAAKRPGCN